MKQKIRGTIFFAVLLNICVQNAISGSRGLHFCTFIMNALFEGKKLDEKRLKKLFGFIKYFRTKKNILLFLTTIVSYCENDQKVEI